MTGGPSVQVFVLIDALGWAFVEDRDFLSDMLPHRQPLRTVLGYSSGAIPTILTGRLPAEHGHWNLLYYDPARSPFGWLKHLAFLPDRLLNHRLARRLLKELGRRVLGLGPLFEVCVSARLLPWFNWIEKRNIYDPGGIEGGPSIFDELARQGVPHRVYSYHRFTDAQILRQAIQDLQQGHTGFFFLYLSEMDRFLHGHCEPDAELDRQLASYADRLRAVFETARAVDPGASFTVLSDHGMTPVRQTFNLVAEIERLGLTMPDDYLAVYDSTMARFWFFSSHGRRAITKRLASIPCGRILGDDELQDLGVLFPDRRYGELVFLFEPGWLIGGSGFNGPGWSPAGMHGYHPDDRYSDAILLSNRRPAAEVRTIADVYRLMLEAGRVTARPGDHRR
ncbi:MAG: alkaline phosphatase family protein [Candidatus Rokuibacteriota bacterium]